MATLMRFRLLLYATLAVALALNARVSRAEPLRLGYDLYLGHFENLEDDQYPGFGVEVLRQVFAAMGQDASIRNLPTNRLWRMVLRGEQDGMFPTFRISERARICSFPDEPIVHARYVLFVRTADIGKLKFSSFDDLLGHNVAVREAVPGVFKQPILSLDLWNFLREHHNMIETNSATEAFHMLAAGRVDYAAADISFGSRVLEEMGLSGKIEPLTTRSVIEGDVYVCFNKARVSPSLVDAFSRELRQFKQSEAFQMIYRKYHQ